MKENETPFEPLEPETVHALRARIAAPGGEGYWDMLHASIMARITAAESQSWWMVLSRWTRPALAAAALIMVIATAAMIALSGRETQQIAYEDLLDASLAVPMQTARATTPSVAREATFQFVMSSNGGRAP